MLDLAKVLQFVEDGFDEGPAAQDGLLKRGKGNGLHVLFDGGDELDAHVPKRLGEPFGDVALVGEEHAGQSPAQAGDRLAVIDVAGGQPDAEQFAL